MSDDSIYNKKQPPEPGPFYIVTVEKVLLVEGEETARLQTFKGLFSDPALREPEAMVPVLDGFPTLPSGHVYADKSQAEFLLAWWLANEGKDFSPVTDKKDLN